jgi:two-component system cell cycle response regulator
MNDPTTLAIDGAQVSLLQALDGVRHDCLILFSGSQAGRRFDLEPGQWIIGRGAEADIPVTSQGISRRHAALIVGPADVELHDLGSANATYVNDRRLTRPLVLQDGDWLRLADVLLRFHGRRSLEALLHDRMYRLATVDPGTGVSNRRHAHEALRVEVARARRSGAPLAVLCGDLDQFKAVNDSYGHAAGDRVLMDSAALLRAELRAGDVIGRWGGEEFLVVAPGTSAAQALGLAERLRQAVAAHSFELEVGEGSSRRPVLHWQTLSFGVAMFDPAMRDEHDLLALADRRLYAAKRAGRDRTVADDGPA